jgi:pilus assembly protein CpaE
MPAFIVADQGSIASRIGQVLNFGGHDCPSSHILPFDFAVSRLSRETAIDLLVVALGSDIERGLVVLSQVSRFAPGKVLAVGPALDSKLVLRALRSGADDYVDSAEMESELESAINRLLDAARGPVEAARLISLLAPNGGSGSSTIAVNLATILAKEYKSVALFDLKLEAGDLAALMDLKPEFTLAEVSRHVQKLDRVMFERSLVKHESGVSLLAAPRHLDDASLVKAEGISQAMTLARSAFPFVVADVDHSYREEQRVILRQSDVILVPFRLDFASLRNVRRALEFMNGLDIDPDKILLVVNRYGQAHEVPYVKAAEALGREISHFVPEDTKTVNRANNHGVPLVIEAPTSKVAKSFQQLALLVDGRHDPKKA